MEENTSKVLAVGDPSLATGAFLTANGAGSSLFVINLCASMAPTPNIGKSLPGLEAYRLYQVARREDGRTRYRLRLGFFTTEADAEAVLGSVRDAYPTAFTACLCDEDRKFARGFVPESTLAAAIAPAPKPVAVAPKIAVVESKAAPKVDLKPAPAAAPKVETKPAAASKSGPTTDTITVKALGATAKTAPPKPAAPPIPPKKAEVIDDSLDSTAKHKRIAEPKTATPSPAKAAAKPAPAPISDDVEIELSWDPPALQPAATAKAAQVVTPALSTQNVIKAAPPAATAKRPEPPKAAAPQPAKKETIAQPSKLLADIELTLESEPASAPAKAATAPAGNEPFRVNKGVEIPKTSLSLEAEASAVAAPAAAQAKPAPAQMKPAAAPTKPAAPIPAAAQAAPAKPIADISKMKAAHAAAPAAIKSASAPTSVRKVDGPPPDLDSTQTIRALTNDELKDDSQEKWFAIQLAISDQPVNLDAMPRLDIFEAYRLYSVASAGSGKITHALRLGFFREETSADAVTGYLKTFFNSPTVVRISIAEQGRFKDPPAPKPAAKSEGKVLDLSHARSAKVVPTVTMEVETKKFDPMATGSFKASASGSHKALSATGTHKALSATGTHKALKAASKAATPPTKRSAPVSKSASMTGKHKALQPKKSLSEQLMEEAREVELSQSAIRKLPKNESLFSKMFGKKK